MKIIEQNKGIFCDWITVIVPMRHKTRIEGGFNQSMTRNEDGDLVKDYHTHKMVRMDSPSHSSTFSIKTIDVLNPENRDSSIESSYRYINMLDLSYIDQIENYDFKKGREPDIFYLLEISGNPTKWLQGHNLMGSNSAAALIIRMLQEVASIYDIDIHEDDIKRWHLRQFYMKRLDLTGMFDYGSERHAIAFLTSWCETSSKRAGTAFQSIGLTGQIGSKRLKTIAYYKYDESLVRKDGDRRLKTDMKNYDEMLEWTKGKVRIEHKIGTQWFQDNGRYLNLLPNMFDLYYDILNKINFGGAAMNKRQFSNIEEQAMDSTAHKLFRKWRDGRSGEQLKEGTSAATFYAHKKILREMGLNLNMPCPAEHKRVADNVVYLSPAQIIGSLVNEIPDFMEVYDENPLALKLV